jgi:hypothetical protein
MAADVQTCLSTSLGRRFTYVGEGFLTAKDRETALSVVQYSNREGQGSSSWTSGRAEKCEMGRLPVVE